MTLHGFRMLLPLCIPGVAAVASALLAAFFRNRTLSAVFAICALAATIAACVVLSPLAPRTVAPLFVIDHFALFYSCLVALGSLGVALVARDYFHEPDSAHEEFFTFLLLSTFGATVIVSSAHFISLFLGLEILNVALYVLIAWRRLDALCIEAALKYLVPGTVGGAFLLFGMGLVYAELGTMELATLVSRLAASGAASPVVVSGLLLIMVGIGFKLALVPFHLWTPDVYEGAPLPASMLVATISKAAVFALFLRYFYPLLVVHGIAAAALPAMAMASMIVGNLLALRQQNLMRIIAYSSIAHTGYFLSAFLGGAPFGVIAATYYLTAYVVTIVIAFGVLSMVSLSGKAETIDDLRALAVRSPRLAGAFTVACASLAGLPLAAGFFGKFYALAALARSGSWAMAATLVATSGIGIYYYVRIMSAMFEPAEAIESGEDSRQVKKRPAAFLSAMVVSIAVIAVIVLGTVPAPLTSLITFVVGGTP